MLDSGTFEGQRKQSGLEQQRLAVLSEEQYGGVSENE